MFLNAVFRTKVALFSLLWQVLRVEANVIVNTNVGPIQGVQVQGYVKFLGIPYAQVNTSNPFGPSIPFPKFEDILEANNDSVTCPQASITLSDKDTVSSKTITLNCLILNIYVPSSANSNNLLPILAFIHGGGYTEGSSNDYDPRYLLRHDVIFVSFNYRLGPYGFMCLGTPEVPGNQGLKDQLSALKWVKDNIQSFGGDPNKITLSGQSAGAMSTDFHLHSNLDKVFNQVILESGTSLIPEAPLEKNSSSVIKLASLLGHNVSSVVDAISFLTTADPMLVVNAAFEMERFLPCVEKDIPGVEAFLKDYPINMKVPKVKDMNIIIGFNSQEMEGRDIYEALKWAFTFDENDLQEMTNIVQHYYIGDEDYNISKLADFDSDFNFNYPAERSVSNYIKNGASNVYYYIFSYVGGLNSISDQRITKETKRLAGHSDELAYLYYSEAYGTPSQNDQLIIDRMTTMWTNFIKYGNPTPSITPALPLQWEPVTNDSRKYFLTIDTNLVVSSRPYKERMSFWDLFYNRNKKLQRGYRDGNEENINWNGAQNIYLSYLTCIVLLALNCFSYTVCVYD